MFRSPSNLSKVSNFSVSTGGQNYVPVNSPLGKTAFHDHFIRPVPPTFVTEYEAAYTWPKDHSYNTRNTRFASKTDSKPKPLSNWAKLLNICNSLIAEGYEINLFKAVLAQINSRKLDALLEYAYNHVLDVADSAKGGNGISNINVTTVTGDKVSETVLKLCDEFVKTIEGIKSC